MLGACSAYSVHQMEDELNVLIDKYRGFIDHINGTNEFDVFTGFYNDETIRIVEPWVRSKFNKTTIKCRKKALLLREDGNRHFKTGNWVLAVNSYTMSVIYAPFNSLEYNLSLGNRSAALYHLGKYTACVQDLELCLDILSYPETKKYKLYLRLIQSYIDLKLGVKAQETHTKLQTYLSSLKSFPDEFNDKLICKYRENADNLNELIKLIDLNAETTKNTIPTLATENKQLHNASDAITLKLSDTKGRFLEATRDIKHGDVLFIEKTLCFVPILNEGVYKNICYNCFQEICAPIPCDNCNELFCSLACKHESWTRYHRFECVGSCTEIWKNIGVNFLAFRIFLFGFQNDLFHFQIDGRETDIFGGTNWYKRTCALITNVEKMGREELLPHLVSTLIIVCYLKEKTNFLGELRHKYPEYSAQSDAELFGIIGGVLLKHILQVICNASIIESVSEEFYKKFDSAAEIKESGMFVQGTGLFPSVSLMNHSCDSNVTNYFLQDTIIVKANRNIDKGEEILNCYGHDCRSESTNERRSSLKFQYYFDCCCCACRDPTRPELYENGMYCPECNNWALNQPVLRVGRCLHCKYEFKTEEYLKTLGASDKLYKKWQITRNIKYLEECYQTEQKIYYKYNYKLYDLIQDLQIYHKNQQCFQEWWKYTQLLLDLDKTIYGPFSLKYGLNIRQTLIDLCKYLSRKFLPKEKHSELLLQAEEMLQTSKEIFVLYYPKNKLKFHFICSCLQKLRK